MTHVFNLFEFPEARLSFFQQNIARLTNLRWQVNRENTESYTNNDSSFQKIADVLNTI